MAPDYLAAVRSPGRTIRSSFELASAKTGDLLEMCKGIFQYPRARIAAGMEAVLS